jgi:endonuclease/exonuclease/phosphatase family metal-dependent hydrolase
MKFISDTRVVGKPDAQRRPGLWLRRAAIIIGAGYPLGLLVAWLVLRFSGEGWWVPLVGLYAPPVGFLFPAPIALLVTWRWAGRRWVGLQLAAVVFALFGLLGLELGLKRDVRAAQDPHAIRLVSYNIALGYYGVPAIVEQVRKLQPNLVLLQEDHDGIATDLQQAFAGWHTDRHGQFFIASRFPILDVKQPEPLRYQVGEGGSPRAGEGGARFIAYTLGTDVGPVDVFNVHTSSPREGLEDMRGNGFLHELRHGSMPLGRGAHRLTFNAYRRRRQVQGIAAAVRASSHPVIVAGDFNLPALSHVVRDNLGDLDDAFVSAGRGFGYTYPTKFPFLRIDRIFVGHGLRAVAFHRGDTRASDHFCVSAVITTTGPVH